MRVGEKFNDFQDLQNEMERFQRESFANYYIRTSQSVENYCKSNNLNMAEQLETLKYTRIVYACIHGGRKFKKNVSTGTRPNQK